MSDGWILIGIGVLVLASIVYELTWGQLSSQPWELTPEQYAYKHGYYQAAQGMTRDNYPMDYTPAEIEAWQRGWDEYMENRNA